MDTFEHWPLHIERIRISVYCESYLQSISTTTTTGSAHMPHAACRLAHLSRHYAQIGVESGLLVYFRLLRLYCQPCPMLWLSKRLFSLPFAFQFRRFAISFSALFRAVFCETLSQSFPFFRYTALLLFLLHVFHLALPLWPFYYDFVDFAFPAKNNIGEVLQVPHAKTEYSARHQSKTVHSG